MRNFLTWALALSLCVVGLSSCSRDNDSPGKDSINGKDGKSGKDGNTILSGKGEPSAALGKNGDFYLDEDTKNLYGPKSDKGWGNPANLKGKDGKNGSKILKGNNTPDSNLGNEGDWYIDVANKRIYYKNTNNWEEIFNIGSNNAPTTLKGDYILSKDGTVLYTWLNKELNSLNMQTDPELNKVTTIGDTAFNNHTNLTQITLPNGLKKIGNNAFINASLTSITIPNGVTSIGSHAFSGNQLSSVTIPNSITTISHYAFYGNLITSITIPSSVISIGDYAFYGGRLEQIKIEATVPPSINDPFPLVFYTPNNSNNPITIYVPAKSLDIYKQAEGWINYKDYIHGY